MFTKFLLILFLLPQGVREIPDKCKTQKSCGVHQFRIEKQFDTKKGCVNYLKNTFGTKEFERRLFADYFRYGFWKCQKNKRNL